MNDYKKLQDELVSWLTSLADTLTEEPFEPDLKDAQETNKQAQKNHNKQQGMD